METYMKYGGDNKMEGLQEFSLRDLIVIKFTPLPLYQTVKWQYFLITRGVNNIFSKFSKDACDSILYY